MLPAFTPLSKKWGDQAATCSRVSHCSKVWDKAYMKLYILPTLRKQVLLKLLLNLLSMENVPN